MLTIFVPVLSAVGGAAMGVVGTLLKGAFVDKPAQRAQTELQQQQLDVSLLAELRLQAAELRSQAEFWRTEVVTLRAELVDVKAALAETKARLEKVEAAQTHP